MLINGKPGHKAYGNSLYYLVNFPINLKRSQYLNYFKSKASSRKTGEIPIMSVDYAVVL